MRNIINTTLVIIAVIALGFGGWILKRKFNYSLGYEDQVNQTIEKNMKRELNLWKKELHFWRIKNNGCYSQTE